MGLRGCEPVRNAPSRTGQPSRKQRLARRRNRTREGTVLPAFLLGFLPAFLLAFLLAFVPGALALAASAGGASLLQNGNLAQGAGGLPSGWHTVAWDPTASQFGWEVAADGAGTIRITSLGPNDARWCQTVAVEAGATYRFSGRVRTSGVGMQTAGALLVIEPRIADTADVRGTHDWQTLEVGAQAGEERSWDVCARLGSYANLNTGTAWFTDLALVQVTPATAARRARPAWLDAAAASLRQESAWTAIAAPIVGGLLLALGLGILGRHRRGRP